jgi:drug/metabolite transporter (DMT)-like permease
MYAPAAVSERSVRVWGALFARMFGRWPSRREWIRVAVGFAGMILLNAGTDLRAAPAGALALLASAAGWALGSTWSRRLQLPQGLMLPATQLGALALVVAGVSSIVKS